MIIFWGESRYIVYLTSRESAVNITKVVKQQSWTLYSFCYVWAVTLTTNTNLRSQTLFVLFVKPEGQRPFKLVRYKETSLNFLFMSNFFQHFPVSNTL